MSEKNIASAIDRTSSFDDAKIIMTANPMGSKEHWFYRNYIDDAENKGIKVIHFVMQDNLAIKNEKIEQFRKIFTTSMYQQRVLGQWVVSEGMVYGRLPEVGRTDKITHIYFGLDVGEHDATTVVAVGYYKDTYYIIDQYYHKNKDSYEKKLITDYQKDIVDFINGILDTFKVPAILYCETSPSSMYNLLRRDGRINTKIAIKAVNKGKVNYKSKDAIQERIDVTNLLINNDMLKIFDKDLQIYKAFSSAQYDKKNNRLDDGTSDIDSLDAFEYAIKIDFKLIMKKIEYEVEINESESEENDRHI